MERIDGHVSSGNQIAAEAQTRDLVELIEKHNSKEEPIIYRYADIALGPEAAEELDLFIGMGVMPDGWVLWRSLNP